MALLLFALAASPSLAAADASIGTRGTAAQDGHQRQFGALSQVEFNFPIHGSVIRAFDPPEHAWLAGHRGVDLAANIGDEIFAAGAGRVTFAGVVVDRPVVSIDHSIGIRTTYEPVTALVTTGQVVERGQIIGALAEGNDHCGEPCLHWGARIGRDTYLDPLSLLRPPIIRLYVPEPW